MVITGLTKRQVELLQEIWECKTLEDLHVFLLTLDADEIPLGVSLAQLVQIEYIDSEQARTSDLSLAKLVIDKIK